MLKVKRSAMSQALSKMYKKPEPVRGGTRPQALGSRAESLKQQATGLKATGNRLDLFMALGHKLKDILPLIKFYG